MDSMQTQYWPFDVLAQEQQSVQHKREIRFLETAYRAGFSPYKSGLEDFGANFGTKGGRIIYRGNHGKHWELRLGTVEETALSAHVDDFDCAAEAVLRWLSGTEAEDILDYIRNHLLVNRARWVRDLGVGVMLHGKKIEAGPPPSSGSRQ